MTPDVCNNLPIAYDFHGDTPFSVPFLQIKPQDIHIYLDLDTKVGARSCGQSCNHCWFVNYEKVYNKEFPVEEGHAIKRALDAAGYKVFARYADSFAYNGDFMRRYGPAHNREFRQGQDHRPTDTMIKGDAWTSGQPLFGANHVELLDLARESGYGTISITFHGLIGPDLAVGPHADYPIKGTFSGAHCEVVVGRIQAYNAARAAVGQPDRFRVNIGVTIGRHNHSRESLRRYALYFNRQGVDTVRFNNFTDHGSRHPHLQLTDAEVAQVYADLKWLHEQVPLGFQLAVSEDFGTPGVEVMGFPAHVGWCQAGRQLFTVIPAAVKPLDAAGGLARERIGDIVACVNIFEPHLGSLVRRTGPGGVVDYALEFDAEAIDAFADKRLRGVYQNGCFAKELRHEVGIALSAQAQAAIARRSEQAVAALEAK